MRMITSQDIDRWVKRIQCWKECLDRDSLENVAGSITLQRENDGLVDSLKISLHIFYKGGWSEYKAFAKDIELEVSTLDGDEEFCRVENLIHDGEAYWWLPSVDGMYYTTVMKEEEAEEMRRKLRRMLQSKPLNGARGYMSTYEQDECIGYDSAQ